jgi:putative ABC transport system permease protein
MPRAKGPVTELGRFLRANTRAAWSFSMDRRSSTVPLAWRNLFADKRRLLRSTSGITFAVLLMLLQLGFRNAFLESALAIIQNTDGDLFITSATKFRFGRKDPFSYRVLYAARGAEGVQSARPIYGEWMVSAWKNPSTGKSYNVQVLAFDPDQPVFRFPEIAGRIEQLKQSDTAMFDQRGRRFLGAADNGAFTELARRRLQVIGSFSLGPDFTTDGTVIMSDWNFRKFFPAPQSAASDLSDVEIGVIKVRPGFKVETVQDALKRALPASVVVRSRAQLLALETAFQNSVSPVGPIFMLGTAIGFIVGLMISYQILYTELSDQLSQYATLKAMGYENSYLVGVVLMQAGFYGLVGFLPAWILGLVLFRAIGNMALLPMHLGAGIALGTLLLTVGMCVLAGMLAVRRILDADPAEVF